MSNGYLKKKNIYIYISNFTNTNLRDKNFIREKVCKKKCYVIKNTKYIRNIAEKKSREAMSCESNWLIGKKRLFTRAF